MSQFKIHPIVMGTKNFDIMVKVREMTGILLPLHEPKFAGVAEIP